MIKACSLLFVFWTTFGNCGDFPFFVGTKTDREIGKLILQNGHTATLCGAMSRDGKYVATGGLDGITHLWELDTGKMLRSFEGHSSSIAVVAFSPDGKWLLTGSYDRTARLWQVETGAFSKVFVGHNGRVFAVRFAAGAKIVTVSDDNTIRVWDMLTAKEVAKFASIKKMSAVINPNGNALIASEDFNRVYVWDYAIGQERRVCQIVKQEVLTSAISGDGKVYANAGNEEAHVWDVLTEKKTKVIQGFQRTIQMVRLSEDGSLLATYCGDRDVHICEVATGKNVVIHGSQILHDFQLTKDHLLTIGLNSAELWKIASGEKIQEFRGRSSPVSCLSLSRDDKWLCIASNDGIRLWDLENGRQIRRFNGNNNPTIGVAMNNDGKKCLSATTGGEDYLVRIWDTSQPKQIRTVDNIGNVLAMAISTDSKTFVTAGADGTARLWDFEEGKLIREFQGHDLWLRSAAISKNGKWLVTSSDDDTARVWEIETGKEVNRFKQNARRTWSVRYPVLFSNDGGLIFAGYDMTVRQWKWSSNTELREFRGHSSAVNCLSITIDDKYLITGADDNTARVWHIGSGRVRHELRGHSGSIQSVAVTSDGERVITGSTDGTIRVWAMGNGTELCRVVGFQNGSWAVFDSAGRFDGSNEGKTLEGLHFVVGNKIHSLNSFREKYYDPGLLAKYLGFNKQLPRSVGP